MGQCATSAVLGDKKGNGNSGKCSDEEEGAVPMKGSAALSKEWSAVPRKDGHVELVHLQVWLRRCTSSIVGLIDCDIAPCVLCSRPYCPEGTC